MCDQQRLKAACAYAQSEQSLCLSVEDSMTLMLLTKYHLSQNLSSAAVVIGALRVKGSFHQICSLCASNFHFYVQ